MTEADVRRTLSIFFPKSFEEGAAFLERPEARLIINTIKESPRKPINRTQANQLLHLCHEAGMSEGFFRYYFLFAPPSHPYPVSRVSDGPMPGVNGQEIWTLDQFEWGVRRFFIDALLYWGDIRSAYRAMRSKSFSELEAFFKAQRIDTAQMLGRGTPYPFEDIPDQDRYLISEFACKAYTPVAPATTSMVEQMLAQAFTENGEKEATVRQLIDGNGPLRTVDPQTRMILEVGAEELLDVTIRNVDEVRAAVRKVRERFELARPMATRNTDLYLSLINEIDVYVATSMRKRDDFLTLAKTCRTIFGRNDLKKLNIRYFDPTMSVADGHEDKGLIECLMVKCSKATLYFAGEGDSFGKDAEIAMSMSLGKPVIIYCPDTEKGKQRERVFQEIHPLSRLINFQTGAANGAMVTRNVDTAAVLLERLFDNRMEYTLEQKGDGYFRLRERLSGSVVRLQTNHRLLRETFWNYYHGVS